MQKQADMLLKTFKNWAGQQNHIKGVAVVGSFARGDFHSKSDLDLTIISTNKTFTLEEIKNGFIFDKKERVTAEEWGILTSLRVYCNNGLEVEYGVVTDHWVNEPLDQGTKNVVTNGFMVILEKEDIFFNIRNYLNQ